MRSSRGARRAPPDERLSPADRRGAWDPSRPALLQPAEGEPAASEEGREQRKEAGEANPEPDRKAGQQQRGGQQHAGGHARGAAALGSDRGEEGAVLGHLAGPSAAGGRTLRKVPARWQGPRAVPRDGKVEGVTVG
jgi:hypothetical protein